jgi:hypothetical protein
MKKAVIVAPFWTQPGHVGNHRIERFVRWLSEEDFQIILLRAGFKDGEIEKPWGIELTVRDPLGQYDGTRESESERLTPVKPKRLRKSLAYWLFNPDPTVVWAWIAARHPSIGRHIAGSNVILSSNPPESAHVAAWWLSKRFGIPHIVDMRDGWLDEPLRPMLVNSRLRRWREIPLERRILTHARSICVTSEGWKRLLTARYPQLAEQTTVHTNGYPPFLTGEATTTRRPAPNPKQLTLIHAGRFLGSSPRRTPSLLLAPLAQGLAAVGSHCAGQVILIGKMEEGDSKEIERWRGIFDGLGWDIVLIPPVERSALHRLLCDASGLLLLSEKQACIPCKIFEYIPVGRPIFVVTPLGSAAWSLVHDSSQCFLMDTKELDPASVVSKYLAACLNPPPEYDVPHQFTDSFMRNAFLSMLSADGMV